MELTHECCLQPLRMETTDEIRQKIREKEGKRSGPDLRGRYSMDKWMNYFINLDLYP